jgi:hypothetical protein
MDALSKLKNLAAKYRIHEDGFYCQCKECLGYGLALDYVNDNMTESQAIQSIMNETNFTYDKTKQYVDSMIDTGYLSF